MRKILFLVIIINCNCFSQEAKIKIHIPDSIESKSYFEIYELFYENLKTHPQKAQEFANMFLVKGKFENRRKYIAQGYYLMSHFYKEDRAYLKYSDSILQFCKNSENNALKVRGYLLAGDYYLKKGRYLDAFDNYKKADTSITSKSHSRTLYRYNRSIGRLRSRIGKHENAIKIFRESYDYAVTEGLDDQFEDMLFLAQEFNHLKMLDSVVKYNNLGIKRTINTNNTDWYNVFVLNSGVMHYHSQSYKKAIDSISKALPYFKNRNRAQELINSYLYLGKSYNRINIKDQMVHYLVKMDSVSQINEDIIPDCIEGYELLRTYFKERNNVEKELLYKQRQIYVDSIYNINSENILQKIISPYNTLVMISKKENKLANNRNDTFDERMSIILMVIILIVFSAIMIYLNIDRIRYRKSFRAIVSYTNKEFEVEKNLEKKNKNQLNDLNISEEVIERILNGIKDFENSKRYLDKKYSLQVLSKELNTNSTYLSKIINIYKQKSFSGYLHDLRIGYAIERLKDDKKFRLYSIKGISEEIGFKSSESFAKAFHKKTGIYPSSFIKKLKNI
ncbi:helix-turn-helix domain-containing protein [Aquimarina aggregata]|uniref:helix-turn-helix domain-containing protein n=1 Tax=Aquimarina aggregata TaxID=1642818 RepID=UPI002491FB6D|nr:helix-turn-helix domain-containing protein [Aquimarina aggregata]